MKTVCIFNQKGGVAKTTTAINLGTYLAINNYKTLIIDIDQQGNATSGLGINKRSVEKTMYDVLSGDDMIEDVVIPTAVNNLFIAPSNMKLAGSEIDILAKEDREYILKNKMKNINNDYDFVIIDCPPSLGIIPINALVASNSILIPIQAEYYALEGLAQLKDTLVLAKNINEDLYIEGVVITMFDPRTNLSIAVLESVKKEFGDKLYETTIPRNVKLAESPSFGLPIALYDSSSKGSIAYNDLTEEFLKKQEDK